MANNTDYTRLLDGYSLVAIREWVNSGLSLKAPLASPTFTGNVTLPTSVKIGNSTQTGLVKYENGTLSIDTTAYLSSQTWREIQVAGTSKIGSGVDTALNFLNGTHSVQFTYSSGLYAEVDLSKYKPDGTNSFIDSSTYKIREKYLPDSVLGQLQYVSTWNATSPSWPSGRTKQKGEYWICSTAGSKWPDGTSTTDVTFVVGDWAIWTGAGTPADPYRWEKVDNTDAISSITLVSGDALTGPVTIPLAASDKYGLIKIGYTTSGKNYPVQLDSNGKAYVNVPWTDDNDNYYQAAIYSSGLCIAYGVGIQDLYVPVATASEFGVIKPYAVRTSAISANAGQDANRYYGVQLDKNGCAYVCVPWEANTDHYPTSFAWTDGTTSGPTGSLSGNTGFTTVSFGAIPSATGTRSGVVTTDAQTFAGIKTFNNDINVKGFIVAVNPVGPTGAAALSTGSSGYLNINLTSGSPSSATFTYYQLINDDDGETHYIATRDWVSSNYAASNHTHTLSIASDSGTSAISLSSNTKYKLTAGGSTFIFTTPVDNDNNYYHYPIYDAGLKIANGSSINDLYVPIATTDQAGVVLVCAVRSGGTVTVVTGGTEHLYGLELDAAGKAFVNVPWVNNYHSRIYSSGLKIGTGSGINDLWVPNAGSSQAGVVSTGQQRFGGHKIFENGLTAIYGVTLPSNSQSPTYRTLHNDYPPTDEGLIGVNVHTYSQTEATNILEGKNSDGTAI